jgi:hypothetical protein
MPLDFKNFDNLTIAFLLKPRPKRTWLFALIMLALLNNTSVAERTSPKPSWLVIKNSKIETPKADVVALEGDKAAALEADIAIELKTNATRINKVKVTLVNTPSILLEPNLEPNLAAILSLRPTLNLQFEQIQLLAETADSFDQRFGELYTAYAQTLMKVGRLKDARKMFANALHNVKVNNGVNSIQQRPALREQFEMELAIGNVINAETHLKRLLWIEKKSADDGYSFDMVMALGNYYLNQYLVSKKPTETSLVGLNKSIHYFGYALRRYSTALIAPQPLPYGDFAYAHYLKRLVRIEVDFELYIKARERSGRNLDAVDARRLIVSGFTESNYYLRQAYAEAKKSSDVGASVRALLSIADLYLLYGNTAGANTYYQLAGKNTEYLAPSHSTVENFDTPLKLPAFKLSIQRDPSAVNRAYQTVPMLLDINNRGFVGNVTRQSQVDIPMAIRIRAKKTAQLLRFRPIIEDGNLKPIKNHPYNVQVPVRVLNRFATIPPDM